MALWDFSNVNVTFDNPNYFFDGSIFFGNGIYVPNMVGEELYAALGMLQTNGVLNPSAIGYFGTYPVTVIWVRSSAAPPGTVLAQSIYHGTNVLQNSLITLTVVEYPISVAFP